MRFPQRLLAEDEKLVLVLRRHLKVLFGPILVAVAVVVALAAAGVAASGGELWLWAVLGAVGAVILIRWSLWPFLVWFHTVYAITTRRLILRNGVFNRSGRDMPLSRLNDVSFKHNLIERMLGCGTLVVESAGEHGQLLLDDVPKVELVQRTLYQLADELRGVHGDVELDPGIARSLDDAFDEEYRGPSEDEIADRGPGDRRS
jgi:uncharacterized membrane protein YdbT with pleckstrin-like domain